MGRRHFELGIARPTPELDRDLVLRGKALCQPAYVRPDPPISMGVLERSYIEGYDWGRQLAPNIA